MAALNQPDAGSASSVAGPRDRSFRCAFSAVSAERCRAGGDSARNGSGGNPREVFNVSSSHNPEEGNTLARIPREAVFVLASWGISETAWLFLVKRCFAGRGVQIARDLQAETRSALLRHGQYKRLRHAPRGDSRPDPRNPDRRSRRRRGTFSPPSSRRGIERNPRALRSSSLDVCLGVGPRFGS